MASCGRCWHRNVSIVEEGIAHVFGLWGVYVSKHPLVAIVGSLIFAGILSCFITLMESETKSYKLYAPQSALPYLNFEEYQDTWGDYEDSLALNDLIISLKDDPSGNILTEEYLLELQALYNTVNTMEITHDGTTYTYQDICYQYENGNCAVRSILDLFEYNSTTITSSFNSTEISYPSVEDSPWSYGDLYLSSVLGENITLEYVPYPIAIATPACSMAFYIDKSIDEDVTYKWYEEYLSVLETYGDDSDIFDIAYQGYESFDDELARAVGSDVTLFVIGFNALGVFSTLMVLRFKKNADGKCRLDGSRCRARIGWLGIVSAGLAVLSSFGLVGGIFGVKFNSVVAVAPFLLVGIGC